jgi:diguanylate cyclase (GGDEF)-like protein
MTPTPDPEPRDPVAFHRDRLIYAISIAAVVFLVPFAVSDLLKGRYALGASILVVVATLGADGLAVHLKKEAPVPLPLLLVPAATAITLSLRTQGVIGAFWCYPLVLFFFFVLSRRVANLCSAALLLEGTFMVYRYIGVRVTIRFFVSLTLTIVIINIIQSIIRELQDQLVAQAITDPLTGAFNRRYMAARLAEAAEQSQRRAAPVSLLMIDIDHFKAVNDDHGHDAGDRALKALVALVRKRARLGDLLFRMGGEEFVLLLPDTAEAQAAALADEHRASIADAALLDGRPMTVSIGVGARRGEESVESWLEHVDAALYAAKRSGRNRVASRETDNRAEGLRMAGPGDAPGERP